MDWLYVRNWERWQTWRSDRAKPPWVKVHRCLLLNADWCVLSDAEKGQLLSIWLLAAEKDGWIPASPKIVQKVLGLDKQPNLIKFKELGFLQNGDASLAPDRRHDDAIEERRGEEIASPNGEESPAEPGDPCPYEKIVERYHEMLPELPRYVKRTEARDRRMKARWREHPGLHRFEEFFRRVQQSPFLLGRNSRGWSADLEWLMRPENFAKVLEGKYFDRST